jgi:formylglycine-generating enzyme required for sulfatase activity
LNKIKLGINLNCRIFRKPVLWCAGFLLLPLLSNANNLKISGLKLVDALHIQFTISWENSWKLEGVNIPYNHDAIWIFFKYRKDGEGWQHLNINPGDTDLSLNQSGNISIKPAKDASGLFVSRLKSGGGNITGENIMISLAQGIPEGNYEFKAFGIEMVWINEGTFYLGDSASQKSLGRGNDGRPYQIISENAITTGKDSLSLRDTGQYDPKQSIPVSFPKGYSGFYCMKYEISQEQYAAFLNCLTYRQQQNRTGCTPSDVAGTGAFGLQNRNGIVIETPGREGALPAQFSCNADNGNTYNDPDDGEKRACNFLAWADVTAYLDWAALRPMSELEFEKVCRGPLRPVPREFSWGTPYAVDANTIEYDASDSESTCDIIPAGSGIASYGYTGPMGPLRTGFAARTNTGRLQSGASYYGAMEMSGDLWELCVNIIDPGGLKFDNSCGNGNLDEDGNTDIATWPGINGEGAGYRGGGFLSGVTGEFRDPAISSRFYAGLPPIYRRNTSGGRGVRGR